MTKLGAIVTIKGKGNYITLDSINVGEFVQISWSDEKDADLESEGTFEINRKDELKDFVHQLAKKHQFVLISVQ